MAEMRVLAELAPRPGGGATLIYQVWARPRNIIGVLGIPAQIGLLSRRDFEIAFRHYDRVASLPKPSPLAIATHVNFAPGGRERLAALRDELIA
ncbi:MAG: hypothetical protein FJ030_15240 [Chloroflexi bacterium]|nr:hypothetical protein [Chloroflexota bacterium]